VDAPSRKHKYSLNPTEQQDFIPQSIDATEIHTEPPGTFITTNNLSIYPIPEEIPMVSCGCIKFKHTDCNYHKYAGRKESLGHHLSCPYLNDENDGDYKDYDDIKEEEIQSVEDTLSTIPEDIFNQYKLDPHPQGIVHDQLNGYHHIYASTDNASSVTNNENIPAIITDVANDAWDHYKQHPSATKKSASGA